MAESLYWADQVARKIIEKKPKKKMYILEGGLSPSARKHVGSVRELITNDFVRCALESRKKKVKFYYSWDAFDRLKKISMSIPESKRKVLSKYIGVPQGFVPDPFGKCHRNYAKHFEEIMEKEVEALGIKPNWLYQDKEYTSCKYWKLIVKIMHARDKIRIILNKYREHKLPSDWWPVRVYCEKCNNGDDTKILSYDKNTTIEYTCACGYKGKLDFSKVGMVKPTWRVDWPMRWTYFDVDFEPSGKDHMVAGSSYDTCSEVVRKIFNIEPPFAIIYEMVGKKGLKAKMSASVGDIVTVSNVLEIYLKEIARWFFASTKPAKQFVIPFDEEVIKAYEDFYKCERIYFGKEKVSKRDKAHWSRVYEMSCIKVPKSLPDQPAIRTCIEFVNIFREPRKAAEKYAQFSKTKSKRVLDIMKCVKNWLDKYAPEQYKFELQEKSKAKLSKGQKEAIKDLIKVLSKSLNEKQLFNEFYAIVKKNNLKAPQFFQVIYKILLNRERGPRLAPFILAVGKAKVAKLLKRALYDKH